MSLSGTGKSLISMTPRSGCTRSMDWLQVPFAPSGEIGAERAEPDYWGNDNVYSQIHGNTRTDSVCRL
ncbi:hypothetical protein DFP90_102503 [Aestuariispira insulae]|uniref:Uncharacterized protein n=1 Tax=Aestuariispira insulae TaxID=1461337 RepID=A0A3D9HSK4_9PROT|nr:hypothetical protein DFP90_102503 [Aestuariispira insulae]